MKNVKSNISAFIIQNYVPYLMLPSNVKAMIFMSRCKTQTRQYIFRIYRKKYSVISQFNNANFHHVYLIIFVINN